MTIRELVTILGFRVDEAGVHKGDAAFNQLILKSEQLKGSLDSIAKYSAIAFAGVTAGLGLAVKAASDEEAELRRLQTAVEGTGRSWESSKAQLSAFAEEQEKHTNYSHDEYFTALRQIIAITGNYQKGIAGAGLAANVAAKFHIDLESAARAVGFAYEGQLRKVNMILPVLGKMEEADVKLKTASEKGAFAINLLTEETRGAAAKDMGTYASSIKHIAFATDRLRESIGGSFLQKLKDFNINLTGVIDKLEQWTKEHPALTAAGAGAAWAGTGLLSIISSVGSALLGVGIYAHIKETSIGALAARFMLSFGEGGLIAAGIIAATAAIDELWQAMAKGKDAIYNLSVWLTEWILKPFSDTFIFIARQLDILLNWMLRLTGIKAQIPLPEYLKLPEYRLKTGEHIKYPWERLSDLLGPGNAPGQWQGPPAPETPAKKVGESWLARVTEPAGRPGMPWWLQGGAEMPSLALAGGGGGTITNTANVTVNIGSATKADAEHIGRVVEDKVLNALNREFRHAKNNMPER